MTQSVLSIVSTVHDRFASQVGDQGSGFSPYGLEILNLGFHN